MKFLNLFLFGCLIVATESCVSQDDEPSQSSNKKIEASYEAIKPTSIQIIPAKEGMISLVYNGDELIGAYTETTPVEVPMMQYSVGRGATQLQVEYKPKTPENMITYVTNKNYKAYKVIMFEDSHEGGDNDYNDVIIHTCQYVNNNKPILKIQPIAMGNTQVLKLGADFYVMDNKEVVTGPYRAYFTQDLKNEYFKVSNVKSFVNTVQKKNSELKGYAPIDVTNYIPENIMSEGLDGKTLMMNVFIENLRGMRMYAIPAWCNDITSWTQENGYPCGIATSENRSYFFSAPSSGSCGKDWINYPSETQNINTTYPGFDAWVTGNGSAPNWDKPTANTYVDAIGADASNYAKTPLYDFSIWGK